MTVSSFFFCPKTLAGGVHSANFFLIMSGWSEYSYEPNFGTAGGGGGEGGGGGGGGFYEGSSSYGAGASLGEQPMFMTPASIGADVGGGADDDEFCNKPPLLEELGINVEHIAQKTLAVLNPFRATSPEVAGDSDLAGPLAFCLAFGSILLLAGKVHFNYIYGIGVLGCLCMYALLTVMSVAQEVRLGMVVSVLGYCILPIVLLSVASVVFSLQGALGTVATIATVCWCAASASKLFITAFTMDHQQLLVAYPCSLLYAVFALITVF